ncbi:MAG: Rrf2 family transcriptional regulator [Maricaulaceae bacterium]
MRLSEGVEWGAHVCALLAALPDGVSLSGLQLAEFHEVPPAYLAKHLQALSRADVIEASRGPAGGYRLARPASEITLWDVARAIEGSQPAFRCQDIRKRGPVGATPAECKRMCGIARSFLAAETAWRDALNAVTIAEMVEDAAKSFSAAKIKRFTAWLETAAR